MISTVRRLVVLSATLVVALSSAPASAQDDSGEDTQMEIAEETREKGPIVRRKLLYRSTRLELNPHAGFTINDAFRRNILFGASVMYHLTNSIGLGGSFAYAPVHLDTDLAKNVHATLETSDQDLLDDISYSQIQWVGDVTLSYVPVFGKFSVLKTSSINYDLHLNAGLAFVNQTAVAATDGGAVDDELTGLTLGPTLTLGLRLFVSDMISVNADLKNMFYSRAEVSRGAPNSEVGYVPMATVGVGIFFPGDVKISR